ncbi:hypothetical protein LTR70_000080 [Exophiala xenobiotica]|uniref:N-acetyltransferase domain-containing protein n=1 Tax=Lithohypha guttulata TaxID=1690604 RepID=A0ABR0KP33_9EURO|nr:hypothetical protein LTR24_000205 [Lithohypha guttulata]KAK5330758.1 hypothetical protein LTR70_000080 [Exophiala xenobiotica]
MSVPDGDHCEAWRIAAMESPKDVEQGHDVVCACFGQQTHDGIFFAMNPGWDTPQGRAAGAKRLVERWRSITKDRNGDPNTVFLKAVVPGQDGEEQVVGIAIWVQASIVVGRGDAPMDLSKTMDLEALYPGNKAEQRYACQLDASLHRRRGEVVKEKATASPPAIMVLDLCVVHPDFQRRGIAGGLVRWGLDEAQRRGCLECTTEASSMGRHVYTKLGFRQEGGEIEFEVDEEFRGRDTPSNIFMRTEVS